MKTRILVTGQNGFIGRNMTGWLKQEGYHVDGWEWSRDDFPKVVEYDWVIHLGAIADNTCQDADALMRLNYEFSQRLFNECNKNGTHLQYASSSHVYGNTRNHSETSSHCPVTPYGWSKFLFDRWVFQQPVSIMVQGFRYFNVYGKWMHLKESSPNFIHQCRLQAKQNGYIEVWENAEHVKRDWTWVGDICKLHTDFIEGVRGSGIWNAGTGLSHSFLDIAETIAEQEGVGIREVPVPEIEKTRWRQNSCANLKHLKETIGSRPWLNVYEWLDTE